MPRFFTSETSGHRADSARSSGRITNVQGQPYPQKEVAKMEYATVVKGGGRKELKKISPTQATTDHEPMEGDHKTPNSTSIHADVRKDEAQESTNDASPHLEQAATKSEFVGLAQHEERISVVHRVQGSGYNARHQTVVFQDLDENENQRAQKKPDDTDSRSRYKSNSGERRNLMRQNLDLEERNRHLTNQLAALSTQLRGVENEHQHTLQLLEAKTSELKGAEAFLAKGDSLSGADVITMVDSLNAEILQVAAFMADRLGDAKRDKNIVKEEARAAHEKAVRSVGELVVRNLESRLVQPMSDDDCMGLQIALQICLVSWCGWIIDSWIPGYWNEGGFLTAIYSQITEREEQCVSGRWRAITRSHLKHLVNMHPHVIAIITAQVGHVLTVAGWSQRVLDEQGFLAVFHEKLARIGTLALRLQTTIGEAITSGDMKALLILPNASFDPGTMEDGFSENRRSAKTTAGERVAGTTDIGLQRSMKGSIFQILRKPKVVLCSALE